MISISIVQWLAAGTLNLKTRLRKAWHCPKDKPVGSNGSERFFSTLCLEYNISIMELSVYSNTHRLKVTYTCPINVSVIQQPKLKLQ